MDCNQVAQLATNQLQEYLQTWKKKRLESLSKQQPTAANIETVDAEKLRILQELCQKGADLNHFERQREFGCIPHVFWCQRLIKFFLDRGMDVNSRDENGDTALHLVIRHSHFASNVETGDFRNSMDVIKLLLKGASADCPDDNPMDVIKLLMASADCNVTNIKGENALHVLVQNNSYKSHNEGECGVITKMLFERGIKLEMEAALIYDGIYPQTQLMAAARAGNLKYCQDLVQDGADLNARDVQGYTALHHALFIDQDPTGTESEAPTGTECAEFLVRAGADTNAKSVSGRDCYDVAIFYNLDPVFTYGATPTKKAEIYQLAGAMLVLRGCYKHIDFKRRRFLEYWEEAMKVYKEIGLKPPKEFSDNFKFLSENKNPSLNDLCELSLKTIVRLSSPDQKTLFWNLLASVPNTDACDARFETLKLVSFEFVNEMASLEERDIYSLDGFVTFFDDWISNLNEMIEDEEEIDEEDEMTVERISYFHSIVSLVISCFNKIKAKTNNSKLFGICTEMSVNLCRFMTLVRVKKFNDAIPQSALDANKRLLKQLINLDLKDPEGNSLLHLVVNNRAFGPSLVSTLVDMGANVKAKNDAGFEPCQVIDWKNFWSFDRRGYGRLFVKMVARGAHFDARNSDFEQPSLKEMFGNNWNSFSFVHDSLKCACARVLAKSVVPYRKSWVPKHVVDFINSH